MMTQLLIGGGAAIALAGIIFVIIRLRRRPRKLKTNVFQDRWNDLQKMCADKTTWPDALIAADKLLDEALRKSRFSGKTMGERLTKAQRQLTNNEAVWFGHKLRSKVETAPDTKLKESEVKQALMGIRQALKDLGAFPDGK
ncbi:MAG TPA: hypothetical protein VF733_00730 [Candidatus Saccharimonadales bacterium]